MKLVTAIIRGQRLDAVRAALEAAGIRGLTVSDAAGYGRQRGHTEVYRGAEYVVDLVPKIKIEILVNAEECDSVVESLAGAAATGEVGDGKVWTVPVEDVLRIRTRERGHEAI